MLENHSDLATEGTQGIGIQGRDVLVADDHTPTGRFFETVDETQQGAFAGTGMADQTKHFTAHDVQIRRLQRRDLAAVSTVNLADLM
jgi:hypothetical protein